MIFGSDSYVSFDGYRKWYIMLMEAGGGGGCMFGGKVEDKDKSVEAYLFEP